MKKLLLLTLLIASCTGCVNGNFEIPEQHDQDKTGTVTLIEFTF